MVSFSRAPEIIGLSASDVSSIPVGRRPSFLCPSCAHDRRHKKEKTLVLNRIADDRCVFFCHFAGCLNGHGNPWRNIIFATDNRGLRPTARTEISDRISGGARPPDFPRRQN